MLEFNLQPIIEYNMTEDEAVAYKIGLLWMSLSNQLFPNVKNLSRFPKNGDPRKGSLFKYCFTLQSKKLIDPKDYKFYIVAQLQMLKSIEIGNTHPTITPACLLGPKAWNRWRNWKKKYENITKSKSVEQTIDFQEIKKELDKTKKFMYNKFGSLTEDLFKFKYKEIERYISLSMISGYYATLSPWTKKYCNLENIDLTTYKIDEKAETYFKEIFHEHS